MKRHKTKITGTKVLLYLAAVFLGYNITLNFNFDGINKFANLNSREYQTLQDEKNKLSRQVTALDKENKDLNNRVLSYSTDDNKSEKIINEMKDQIHYYGMVSGENEVKGKGIKIKVTDGIVSPDDTEFERNNKILHDRDMRNILNAVRIAGGEAMSVNNHRITIHSSVQCNGSFLLFDDGGVEMAPFNIYVIGDPESLKTNLTKEGGYLKSLMARGLFVELESSSEIKMPAGQTREIFFSKEYVNK